MRYRTCQTLSKSFDATVHACHVHRDKVWFHAKHEKQTRKGYQSNHQPLVLLLKVFYIYNLIWPSHSNSGKWKFIGIPYKKCNNPGGHCYCEGAISNYNHVLLEPHLHPSRTKVSLINDINESTANHGTCSTPMATAKVLTLRDLKQPEIHGVFVGCLDVWKWSDQWLGSVGEKTYL